MNKEPSGHLWIFLGKIIHKSMYLSINVVRMFHIIAIPQSNKCQSIRGYPLIILASDTLNSHFY